VLHQHRAPGNTCIGGLTYATEGRPDAPHNDSKGCGGVMRVAPVGLLLDDPYEVAARVCALTHGHPSGWIAGAVFAEVIAALLAGHSLRAAIERSRDALDDPRGDEVRHAIDLSVAAADTKPVSAETVESLGGGWVAEEALAIGLYCALVAEDFRHGVSLAVTHSGDSDSTGELAGQLLGVEHGVSVLDASLLEPLEARDLVEQIAEDLCAVAEGQRPRPERYPPDPPLRRPAP